MDGLNCDVRAGELLCDGGACLLQEQPLKVLLILLDRTPEVATRGEIKKRLWPNDTVVEFDHSINSAIKKLRKALGDSAGKPQYIETVGRRGYRLMVPVEWVSSGEDVSDMSPRANSKASRGGSDGPAVYSNAATFPKPR